MGGESQYHPDVTVVVIVYNDAARLPAAVRSVLTQTLSNVEVIVVDDCSTDHTPVVIRMLERAHPGRVRGIRLSGDTPSGGPGRPRNAGIDAARGDWVMFLDSDDVLDRHALKNLLTAGERSGADLVTGRCVRLYVDTGRSESWMARLYTRQRVLSSLAEDPELLYDPLSTNKLYRRAFLDERGLRFVVGRIYEDNLFTVNAYLAASKIAVIPHHVYTWHVDRQAAALSVTNRAADPRNVTDRIEMSRRADELIARLGTPELLLHKQVKFINHDVKVHLNQLPLLAAPQRRAMLKLVSGYLSELDPEAFRTASKLPAIASFLASREDDEGALAAIRYSLAGPRRRLTAPLTVVDGRVYWCDRHLDTPLGRAVLDVTSLGLHDQPLGQLRLGTEIVGVEEAGPALVIRGRTHNPLRRLSDRKLSGALVLADRRRPRRRTSVPVTVEAVDDAVHWSAAVDRGTAPRPIGLIDPVWTATLRLDTGDETVRTPVDAPEAGELAGSAPVHPRLSRLFGDRLRPYPTDAGVLAFRVDAGRAPGRQVMGVLRRGRSTAWGGRVWAWLRGAERRALRRLDSRQFKVDTYHALLTRLPLRKRGVVFESHLGRSYSDNPRYIYEELNRRGVPMDVTWSYRDSPKGFPEGVRLVRRESWAYYVALARAAYWVDNQGFPTDLRKRPGTTYIQTWHGSAFKRMGFDHPDVKQLSKGRQEKLARAHERFDAFLVRSEHDTATLVAAMGVRAPLIRVGYPRNDALVTGGDLDELERLRQRLRVDGRRTILWAPTFRADRNGRARPLEPGFDVTEFAERYGRTHLLLIRPHYLSTVVLPPGTGNAVRNVGHLPDITPLMLIADALITDYSSVMFDYSLLNRPMIFFTPDHDEYVGVSRGAYFDLATYAPGPIVTDQAGLFTAVDELDGWSARYGGRLREFTERFSEYDTGTAAKAVVERFFVGGGGRG